MKRRVVITGIGAVSPLGLDLETTWQNVLQGKPGVGPITLFDASTFPCRIAAETHDFSLASYLPDRRLHKVLNRGARFGVGAAHMAMADACLPNEGHYDPERMGVALGSSGARLGVQTMGQSYSSIQAANGIPCPQLSPAAVLYHNYHTISGVLAILHNARGPNTCISTACASGAQAIGLGLRMIQHDDADVVLAGGGDSMINEIAIIGFALLGAVSTRNEDPQRASRPFDRDRDGFVVGEGAAILILEELSHALARGAHIHAELAGYGSSLSAYRITDSPPDAKGPTLALQAALQDAGITPEEVDYINAHGTSTFDNDRCETLAIKKALGERAYHVPVSSTKSMTGHLIAGAGALELAFSVLAIRDQIVPPTINLDNPDIKCDLDYVPHQARPATVNVALSNSFGFGGSNATLVVKRYQPDPV
jgi:3-oxoacyl-[acyl-carrier-protein] synthase II